MAYRINDEIFFLKIDEQVEYLTQIINELYAKDIKVINTNINNLSAQVNNLNETKQDKTSDELKTEVKNIVGSINENHDAIVTNEALIDTKQDKTDNSLKTTNKTIVGAINEVNNKIFTDENIDEIKKELNNKANKTDVVNKSDIINTNVGFSTTYPMSQSAVKNNFWQINPIDSEVGPSKPAVSNRLWKTGFYVTVPTDNTSIPPAWNPNYDQCPGGSGYGSLLNLVNNGGASGSFRQQAQLYFADEPKNVYWRFDFNGQNHSDTANWGGWKRLVNSDEISDGAKIISSSTNHINFRKIDNSNHGVNIYIGEKSFSVGLQTWTLPATMRSTNYIILLSPCDSNSNLNYEITNIYNKTTTTCDVYSASSITYSYLIIETW